MNAVNCFRGSLAAHCFLAHYVDITQNMFSVHIFHPQFNAFFILTKHIATLWL